MVRSAIIGISTSAGALPGIPSPEIPSPGIPGSCDELPGPLNSRPAPQIPGTDAPEPIPSRSELIIGPQPVRSKLSTLYEL